MTLTEIASPIIGGTPASATSTIVVGLEGSDFSGTHCWEDVLDKREFEPPVRYPLNREQRRRLKKKRNINRNSQPEKYSDR